MTKKQKKKLQKRAAADRKRKLNETPDDAGGAITVRKPKSRRLSGGVHVEDHVLGGGEAARLGQRCKLLYEGALLDGTVFDSKLNRRKPLVFRHGLRQVIKGLDLGIEGMREGGKRLITIPPDSGYGATPTGPIPPNSTLVFEVELVGVGDDK